MITSPTQISNCVVWLDATDTTTLSSLSGGAGNSLINTSLTGDFVGGWGDKSGNSRHFTNIGGSASTRPTWIAALSTVRFDGVDDNLTLFSTINFNQQTVFVVAALNSFALTTRIYSQVDTIGGGDGGNNFNPIATSNTVAGVLGSTSDSAWANSSYTIPQLSAFNVITHSRNAATYRNFLNGIGSASFTSARSTYTAAVSRLAAGLSTNSANSRCNISEVIVYDKALTNAEREDVEYYLTRKWSFLNSIPRQVYAIQNGNWSNSTTWSTSADPAPWNFPLSSDNVYSNTFTVTADSSTRVSTLQNTALSPNIAAGGTFAIAQPNITLTVPSGFLAGTTTCITGLLSSGTSVLSGNFGGLGVSHIGNGELRIFGNLTGGSTTAATNNGNGILNVFGNVTGGTAAASYGVNNNSTGNVTISGNVLGGTNATAYGAFNNSSGTLVVNGSVRGNTGIGIYNASLGNCTIVGGISGGSAHGLHNQDNAFVYLNGECRGGTAGSIYGINNNASGIVRIDGNLIAGNSGFAYAARNLSTGTFIIRGDVQATVSAPAFLQSSTGTTLLTGNIIASSANSAYESSNTGARNEFTGSLVNDLNGRQAVYAARYLLRPQMFNSFTRMAGPSATNTPVFYYAPESYNTSFVPHTSSVAVGTAYAAVSSLSGVAVNIPVQLSGTMVVPSVGSVDRGKLVGPSGVGTAIITTESLQKVWDINTATLTATNSIGSRLSNTATIEQVGQQIQTLNI